MAQQDREGSGVPFTGIAVILLIALGFGLPHLGFESTRPQPSHVARDHYPTLQQVPARLWEDPFEAISGRKQQKSAGANSEAPGPGELSTSLPDLRRRIAAQYGRDSCVSLMPVMVFGGPYGEFAEVRRRTRYAVVSGLLRSGFSAYADDHIGYVSSGVRGVQTAVPFEWFERGPRPARVRGQISNDRSHACPAGEMVLVLWIDQDLLEDKPLEKLTEVAKSFAEPDEEKVAQSAHSVGGEAQQAPAAAAAAAGRIAIDRVRVIGPANSKLLRRIDEENACADADRRPWSFPAPLEMYVWGATAPPTKPRCPGDENGPENGAPTGGDEFLQMVDRFSKAGISVVRTAVEDSEVIARLGLELEQRGIDLSSQHFALVAESDTLYGTKLLEIMKRRARTNGAGRDGARSSAEPRVKVFTYLRGLDGETARAAERVARRDESSKDSKKRGEDAVTSGSVAQLDYARRIAEAIHVHHDDMRTIATPTPVIGVLGSDFYDKSLLLQALRKELPQSIFFTTDLDARMTDANQRAWARNLIVGSGHGLRLRDELQGGVAPFRDTYQTATFLATLVALNERIVPAGAPGERAGLSPRAAAEALQEALRPRAFEIGTSEAFDFGPDGAPQRGHCSLETILACRSLDPTPSKYLQLERSRIPIAVLIVVFAAALALGTSWTARRLVDRARGSRKRRPLVLVTLGGVTLYVAWMIYLIGFAEVREPFRWAEGFSAWPTLILRSVAAGLGLAFFYGLARDRSRTKRVLSDIGLEPSRAESMDVPRWGAKLRNAAARVLARGAWRIAVPPPRPSTFKWLLSGRGNTDPADAQQISSEYLSLASLVPRLERVAPLAACYILLSLCLIVLWDLPNAPVRGAQTLAFHKILLAAYIVVYSVLLFAVVDTVRLSEAWIDRLMMTGTAYPTTVIEKWRAAMGIGNVPTAERALSDWISIQLIARHTESTVKLVYYPFIVLAIALVARSQLFDNWHTPTSLMIIFSLGAAYAAFAAIRLRITVERARTIALERMTVQLMALHGSPVDREMVRQVEMLVANVREIRRGAFTPLAQQPLWKALLLPLSGFGGIEVMQYVWMINK